VEEEISRMSLLPSPTLREWTCFLWGGVIQHRPLVKKSVLQPEGKATESGL
jgi:hypothetical protein